tara:strand:+ start:5740 stop:5964 length:225 start_codon:yes stop_codon:yes gene_type:complete
MKMKTKPTNDAERAQKNCADSKYALTDADITTSRVDRRSFLAKVMIAGSLGVSAAMTAACPSGSGGSDSDSDSQ